MKCPMNKFPSVKCSWKGLMTELKKHVRESHEDYYQDPPFFKLNGLGKGSVMFNSNDMHLMYPEKIAGQVFFVVQLVGTNEEAAKYKSRFTLHGANGVDEIVETFVVRSFTEDFSDSFQSGKCFVIDEKVILNFCVDGIVNVQVEVIED
jgi:hypothetical protein